MENNQIIQKSKSDSERKAVASLKLGFISIFLLFFVITIVADVLSRGFGMDEEIIAYLIITPLIVIAVFGLVYGIRGITSKKWYFAIIGILLSIIFLYGVFYIYIPVFSRPTRPMDARIVSDMAQIRTQAVLIFDTDNKYDVRCDKNIEMEALCNDIDAQNGDMAGPPTFVISSDGDAYCAYTALKIKYQGLQNYFCIDSTGKAGYTTNPASTCNIASTTCGIIR